jgi:hypothetical protein
VVLLLRLTYSGASSMMLGGEIVLSIRFVESNAIDLTAMVDGVVMVNQVY